MSTNTTTRTSMDKWSQQAINKALQDMNDKGKYPPSLLLNAEWSEEEVQYDESGELLASDGAPFPKEVYFVEGDKLDPYVLGRVVFQRKYTLEVKDFRMKVDTVNELMNQFNEDAKKYKCEYQLLTRAALNDLKSNMPQATNMPVVQGLKTTSTDFPSLRRDMEPVVEEIKACEEAEGWKRENLTKTAKVLKNIEEQHQEIKKQKSGNNENPVGRAFKGIQGWFPIYCKKCYSSNKKNIKLCETGQVCFWRKEDNKEKKVEMICCRIRIHSCEPITQDFHQPVVTLKEEEYPHDVIVGSTFDGLKETLDFWSPEMRLSPPGTYVDLGLGHKIMQSSKETRRMVYAMNRVGWFGLKVRDVRDMQLKYYFFVGTTLKRGPEFMAGSEEYEYPFVKNVWGTHVYMDGSMLLMGDQRLLPISGESIEEETVQLPWHVDGAAVEEGGKMVPLAQAQSMKQLMRGVTIMAPIQDKRYLNTKTMDGEMFRNEFQRGELAMWGLEVEHSGVQFGPSHSSLDSAWMVDFFSKTHKAAVAKGEETQTFIPEQRIKEENPTMLPWTDDHVIEYAGAAGDFVHNKLRKVVQEANRRGRAGLKKEISKSIDETIAELEAIKLELEKGANTGKVKQRKGSRATGIATRLKPTQESESEGEEDALEEMAINRKPKAKTKENRKRAATSKSAANKKKPTGKVGAKKT